MCLNWKLCFNYSVFPFSAGGLVSRVNTHSQPLTAMAGKETPMCPSNFLGYRNIILKITPTRCSGELKQIGRSGWWVRQPGQRCWCADLAEDPSHHTRPPRSGDSVLSSRPCCTLTHCSERTRHSCREQSNLTPSKSFAARTISVFSH